MEKINFFLINKRFYNDFTICFYIKKQVKKLQKVGFHNYYQIKKIFPFFIIIKLYGIIFD